MNVSEHRRDYAAYCSAVERARCDYHAGHTRALDLRPFEERYADLWSRARVEELRRAREETPADFETERASLRALEGAALLKRAEADAVEVTDELRRCEASARVGWRGRAVSARDAAEALAAESDAHGRAELAGRLLDALGPCGDLRAARLAALGEAARSLGLADRRALYESFTGVDLSRLEEDARRFVERTERVYASRLAAWAAREAAPSAPAALRRAGTFRFRRAPRLATHFPAESFGAVYAGTLAGLGVRAEAQRNLRVDAAPRDGKSPRTACFAVAPPDDVRLVVGARPGGADFYRRALREAGRAQMFAWASRETAARRPEFVRAPDRATESGHAFLFAGLLRDAAWLAEFARGRAHELGGAARLLALVELHDARRDAAVLGHALALDRAADARSESLAGAYAESLTRATGFRHDAASQLLDADEWFGSATRLRARLFAAGWHEHLRARHGLRWFAARAAGDELIDVWNTAARYGAEELARLAWGGGPDFDALAASLTEGLGGHE
jgi:hypothetical protein